MPPYQFDPGTGEKETDPCMVLEVSKALYKEVFPRQEELAYLAHGRQVDLHDCADNIIPMDGCFSVLTANRFPVSSEEPGEKTGVFLISLEGYDGLLPADREGEEPLSDYERLRFICLYTWRFQSVKDGFIGFRQALKHMDVRAVCTVKAYYQDRGNMCPCIPRPSGTYEAAGGRAQGLSHR